jgi:hypothetical protein
MISVGESESVLLLTEVLQAGKIACLSGNDVVDNKR